MVKRVEDGYLLNLPVDAKSVIVSNWSDNTSTVEFYSDIFEMDYDSFEYNVAKQRKEITLPIFSKYIVVKKIPKRYSSKISTEGKWFFIKDVSLESSSFIKRIDSIIKEEDACLNEIIQKHYFNPFVNHEKSLEGIKKMMVEYSMVSNSEKK